MRYDLISIAGALIAAKGGIMGLIAYDGQIELEEDDWLEEDFDEDDLDACGHCGTELSEGWCSVCGEMAD